ncbi:MAG: phospholipase D-like domain-containing protein [Thermoplasmatota archaeon]
MKKIIGHAEASLNVIIIFILLITVNQNFCSGVLSTIQNEDTVELENHHATMEITNFTLEFTNSTMENNKEIERKYNYSDIEITENNNQETEYLEVKDIISDNQEEKDCDLIIEKNITEDTYIISSVNNSNITSNITSNESENTNPDIQNSLALNTHITITSYPFYIPKIQNNSEYGIPFAIRVDMINFSANQTIRFKAYIVGNSSHIYPSNQIWTEGQWKYSYYYFDVYTDEQGNCSDWYYLRFNKNYKEYQNHIEKNATAYIMVRIISDDLSTIVSKKIHLLDMDESTTNATTAGYVVGIAQKNQTIYNDKIVIIKNKTGTITGIYRTENNNIDDDFISEPGYYKVPSSIGDNYSVFFMEDNQTILHTISNITILQGDYAMKTFCETIFYETKRNNSLTIPFAVKNIGDLPDHYDIKIESENPGWNISLNISQLTLNPLEEALVSLYVFPCQEQTCRGTDITISIASTNDYAVKDIIEITIGILSADMTITNATVYNSSGEITKSIGQGEVIRIRANVRNIGTYPANDVDVSFYYDFIDKGHLIGTRHYEEIAQFQKYPSVQWDTLEISPGNHTIIIIVDEKNTIEEFNKSNNVFYLTITIYPTFPSNKSHLIVITDVYYHNHPTIKNEFIAIYNPLNISVDISGWYLTNRHRRTRDDTTKIVFPINASIPAKSRIIATQNATAFHQQMGYLPDFEYEVNSRDDVLQMIRDKNLILSNNGDSVTLKSPYNHTIDAMCYGDIDSNISGWSGPPIPKSGVGVILKRNFENYFPVDTNTSADWQSHRRYGIGQSDFPHIQLNCTGEITTFVSPDSSYSTIVSELRNANESIHFNIYEFTNPYLGEELINALQRNVSVFIFVEGGPVGGMSDKQKGILHQLAHHGGDIRFIVNDVANNVHQRYRFNHAKYLVIDNTTVIVKSSNWALTGVPVNATFGNREWGILIRNRTIASIFLEVFYADWNPLISDSYSLNDMDFDIPSDFNMTVVIPTGSYTPQFSSKTMYTNFSAIPIFSPDTSEQAIIEMINSAQTSIFIQQLYIYRDWGDELSPFVHHLVQKKLQEDIDIKVILNYNPWFTSTADILNNTKQHLEEHGIEVRFHYTNWSYFNNVHNKGMIVDNISVLISSINWNENSVRRNREAGIIIKQEDVALYYADVFFYDWNLGLKKEIDNEENITEEESPPDDFLQDDEFEETLSALKVSDFLTEYKNPSLIIFIYIVTFLLIGRDWRKRKWKS